MSTPNPLVPQGSLERHSKGTSTVRIAIFTIVSIHAVFFAGLLMQGCRRDDGKTTLKSAEALTNQNTLPAIDAGYYSSTQDVAQTPQTGQTPPPAPATSSQPPIAANDAMSTLPPVTALEPIAEGKTYTIAKGDTLAKIARANGTTVNALTKANPHLDGKLHPGQKIQIPASTPPPPSTAGLGYKEPSSAEGASSAAGLYSVKPGETLTRIAKQHGTTVKAIKAANGLKSDRLVVGQKLKIPAGHPHSAGETTKTAAATTHLPPDGTNTH